MSEKETLIDNDKIESMVKKLRVLEESNDALVSIQDKLDRLSRFKSGQILSYDVHHILDTWLVRFRELVRVEACSVFLVDEEGIEFIREVSKPEEVASVVQQEVDAQISLGNFGRAIGNNMSLRFKAVVFGKENGRHFSIMVAPLHNLTRTIGAAVVIFEEDRDFIRQQTMNLMHILMDFFSLSLENTYLFSDLQSTYFSTIRAIANSIEARDPYTKGHSGRVALISKVLAEELRWDRNRIALIDWGGMLHDVGKIGVPDSILNKPGKLTDEEFRSIQMHPLIGAQIVKDIPFLKEIVPYILEHHERFDGKGYSQGVGGKDIAIEGRLLAVADAYDAMTSDRPYRKALDEKIALDEILKNAGTQFDPQMVAAFESAWQSGKISRLGGRDAICDTDNRGNESSHRRFHGVNH